MAPFPLFLQSVPLGVPLSNHAQISRRSVCKPRATAANFFEYRADSLSNIETALPMPSFNPPARSITLLASDLDGTLLNPSKNIDYANVEAAISLSESGVLFVPATGKSRAGAIRAMGKLGHYLQRRSNFRGFPGVFLNGLMVYGKDGEVVWERYLTTEEAKVVVEEGEKIGLVALVYSGDRILVRERRKETDMFIISHEPVPEAVDDLIEIIPEVRVHKVLFVDPKGEVKMWRKELEMLLMGVGDITQARPDVLEVLPKGAGKGEGFVKLIENLGVPRDCTMAIGDGENDLDMIREAGLGVAVANAVPEMLNTADEVVCANGEAAVAYAIRKFITRRI